MPSGITKYTLSDKKFYGVTEFTEVKPEKVTTDSQKFSQTFMPGWVKSNNVVPDAELNTGYIRYDGDGASHTLSGFHIPLPSTMFGAKVHLDVLTVNLMFGEADAKVTRARLCSIIPTSGVLVSLHDDTVDRTMATDPDGVVEYNVNKGLVEGRAHLLELYITTSNAGDFEIYSIVCEYSLV